MEGRRECRQAEHQCRERLDSVDKKEKVKTDRRRRRRDKERKRDKRKVETRERDTTPAERRWTGCRGPCSSVLPMILLLLLLPLSFLSSRPRFAQGAILIPKDYKVQNMSQPPQLTEVPTSFTAFSTDDLGLPCEASGNPTPTFRWVKDGEPFGSERTGSGTIRATYDDSLETYGGHYRCYASNTLGTAMTQTIRVIVEALPALKQQKVRVRVSEGESIILSCNPPESSTPPRIHWMDKRLMHVKQNDRVMIGLDGKLYFSNLLKSDSRDDYICNAQYVAARSIVPVTAVSLTVIPNNPVHGIKPSFLLPTGSHSSMVVLREKSVTLECIPKGLPTPKMEWKKKDGRLDETSGLLKNHNRWLHFDSITLDDGGEYECKASSDHGSASHSFTVTVEAAPYWVKSTPGQLYAPGETVRLDCQAEGIPKPDVTWSINGQPLSDMDDDPRRSVSHGVLILRDVELADTAVYQCEATNKHGSILLNTYLNVVELPPQILSADGAVYRVTEGGSVNLHCEAFGSPQPQITWEVEDGLPLLSDPRASQLTNGTIELSDVGHDDSGAYTCSIKHTNISITAHLEVFNRTVILTGPQDVRTLRGRSALLDCRFYKDPQLPEYQIVWRKDGQKLQESSPDDKYTVFENGTLKVTDVQSDDNAQYSCEVITELDHVEAAGSITVVAPPDPPKHLSLSDVEDHSLTLSWIPGHSHNSPILEYIVEVREEQHAEERERRWEEFKKVPGDFYHLELTLQPFCTYRFRVIAANEIGPSEPSEPSDHHSTPPAVPSGGPTGVRSVSTDPKSLIITWDEMDKRSHNGPGFMYKVSWRDSRRTNANWNHADVLSPPFVVNDTGTYTPFEIKVQAVNSLGEGPTPEPEIGYSGEETPEEAPTGVATTVMNSTVRVKWNEAQNVRGLLLGYKIYIRRLGPQGGRGRRSLGKPHHGEERSEHSKERDTESRVVEVHGSKTSEEVTGLRLFSRYEVSVTAFNSKGEGPHSLPVHFSTPEGAPGPPASLTFESPSEKSLILHWTPPHETNGILLGYIVQYQQDTKDSPLKTEIIGDPNVNSIELDPLDPTSDYIFKVIARTAAGDGPPIEERSATLLEGDTKDSPLKMEIISDPNVNSIKLDPLDPTSDYIFKVIARTAAGDGPPIEERSATLLEGVPPSNITIVPSNTSLNLSWVPGERDRNHGFHIQYLRKSSGGQWEESEVVNSTQGFYSLTGLQPGTEYHLRIVHENSTHWEDVILTRGPVPPKTSDWTFEIWLVRLFITTVMLVVVLPTLCLINWRKCAVKNKEMRPLESTVEDKEDQEVNSEGQPMRPL